MEDIVMIIKQGNLTIRNATVTDAEQLCLWWNDGKVMAHAGFPKGLNETPENIRVPLTVPMNPSPCIISWRQIGEMNYRSKGNRTAGSGAESVIFTPRTRAMGQPCSPCSLMRFFIIAMTKSSWIPTLKICEPSM